MTHEEYLKKISATVSGFELDEKPFYLYERLQHVRDIIEEWKYEKDNCKVVKGPWSVRHKTEPV